MIQNSIPSHARKRLKERLKQLITLFITIHFKKKIQVRDFNFDIEERLLKRQPRVTIFKKR